MKNEIAYEILRQLGGNRFIAMTGAKNFGIMAEGHGIGFAIPRTNNVKYVRVILNGMDTYDMEFLNTKLEPVNKCENVYNEDLQAIFTQQTGLYTHL